VGLTEGELIVLPTVPEPRSEELLVDEAEDGEVVIREELPAPTPIVCSREAKRRSKANKLSCWRAPLSFTFDRL